jgi:hypothetical protein
MIVEFLEDGYQLVQESGYSTKWLSRGDDLIPLTNRDLESVSLHAFRGKLIEILERFKRMQALRNILDLAGGAKSECANSIVERYGEVEKVVNIDLVAEKQFKRSDKVFPVRANVVDAAKYVEPGTVDLAYSSYLFPNLTSSSGFGVQIGLFGALAQTLRDGGLAVVDENPAYFEIYRRSLRMADNVYVAGYRNDFVVVSKGMPVLYHPALDHLDLTPIPL